jgi:hypothetical protein
MTSHLSNIARQVAKGGAAAPDSSHEATADRHLEYRDRVLYAFVRNGRLVAIPSQAKKKMVVLHFLLEECFSEDREYAETEVNERLRTYHEDFASLRRYLVVSGLLRRASGMYRRAESGETLGTQ